MIYKVLSYSSHSTTMAVVVVSQILQIDLLIGASIFCVILTKISCSTTSFINLNIFFSDAFWAVDSTYRTV